ncbi:TetR/AcrR family transcriptional regulator [Zymomonas mobilis]|uniref:Transcriptional regulator, TetR family n=1 Tax=Zymomonas mobilis subsp. pomaceae (strain ATCC 29192 / DSM 22645 / JCM 10191 / CCUG 17912 / NBRC 13757 / NCIMB 11200 / NRRL B-4491 / Barker I) TaxID=579138 RepID=F8ESM5_ZYMMT|nr:TetR/AcrR family transcriptional regulator [Zymomonas mobilis]AEI37800.1 transcriptional regulator, TetR family [Zymomonas mobilis subsp. pomaceae ATCC 29192]MDX5949167.1 TetR/AcrR family transcriptional regulator [Zymomonas mobilis subsp. pomaceae]GEB89803.1 hypothetical protein ZMO02_14400 [Zymomonas mobilis subsp. pomaceae]
MSDADPSTPRRQVGRPPQLDEEERSQLILKAAASVLQTYGYDGASMDRVARQSGMSKKTLYQMFPSKQRLFKKLIEERLFTIQWPKGPSPSDPEEHLCHLLMAIVRTILRPDRLSLFRILAIEQKSDDMRDIMTSLMQGKKDDNLKQWFIEQQKRNKYTIKDPIKYACMICGMTVGEILLSTLFHKTLMKDEDIEPYIREAVHIFLKGLC